MEVAIGGSSRGYAQVLGMCEARILLRTMFWSGLMLTYVS